MAESSLSKRLLLNRANTLPMLACLRACDVGEGEPRPYREVEDELASNPVMSMSTQSPHTLLQVLIEAGGIQKTNVPETAEAAETAATPEAAESSQDAHEPGGDEGNPSSSPSFVADGFAGTSALLALADAAEEDPDLANAALEDQPTDYVLATTDAGREVLAQLAPERRFAQLMEVEPAAYRDVYAAVLDLCATDGGATLGSIEQRLSGHPALLKPKRVYPSYFISKLETVGGLMWSGAWNATDAGLRMRASLAQAN